MSEKPSRTIVEIQQEYGNLCARAGEAQYKLYILQKDLEQLNSSLRDLNSEALVIQAQENAAKAAEGATNVS
jgi:competence protein ComGC